MESNKKTAGIKQMANINNPDFLNYINNTTSHANFEDFTDTKNLGAAISMRINDKLLYRLKHASKLTGISQRVIATNAISVYLQYVENELNENLSEGYNDKV